MSQWTPLDHVIVFAALVLVLTVGGYYLVRLVGGYYLVRRIINRLTQREIKDVEPDPKFCTDCGQRLVGWTAQAGWNYITGKKDMTSILACPNAQSWNVRDYERSCGRASERLGPHLASCAHGDVINFECSACLAKLVESGAISISDGNAVLEQRTTLMDVMSGVPVPPDTSVVMARPIPRRIPRAMP